MPFVRFAALALELFCATLADAATQRSFVASTGVDTNAAFNCSIVKPCRGFAAAIGVTSAKGEVIVLDSAAYVVIPAITQSVTITAPTGIYAGISVFSGDGITINAAGTDTVVLRGLTINGQGGANGITITNALVVHVENCVIANMTGIGINQAKGLLEVKDTIVRNNGNIGVYVTAPGEANLDHVRLEANNTGLAAELGGWVAIQDSIVTGSPNIGIVVTNTTTAHSQVTISRSLISSNNYGIYIDGSNSLGPFSYSKVTVSDSVVSRNVVGIQVATTGSGGPGSYAGLLHAVRNTFTSNGAGLNLLHGQANFDGNYMESDGLDVFGDASSELFTRGNNSGLNVQGASISPIYAF